MKNYKNLLKTLGPGILFAGAAIGGSHLVQSTRAGADYGLTLIWVVILANLLKYPFFEFAQRYTISTGKNILQGYLSLGRWVLIAYLGLNLVTSIASIAAVGFIAANLAVYFLGDLLTVHENMILIMCICGGILVIGNFPLLDKTIKILLLGLFILTTIAFITGFFNSSELLTHEAPSIWNTAGLTFLLALTGWMPCPIEVSSWTSLWLQRRQIQTNYHPTLKEVLLDFNIGYIITALLAIMFLCLGAFVMFGSGESFSNSGLMFSQQLINLFTKQIGQWVEPIVAGTALITMFSTNLTLLDGYPRGIASAAALAFQSLEASATKIYWLWMLVCIIATLILVHYSVQSMSYLLDVATIMSFLAAPIFGFMNYWVILKCPHLPEEARPHWFLYILSIIGLFFLLSISLLFILTMLA